MITIGEILSLKDIILESSIDFPRMEMDTTVWDLPNKHKPILKFSNKEKILKLIKLYPVYNLFDIIKEIRIVGSICSNQYISTTDIDIHMIVDEEKFDKAITGKFETREKAIKDLMKYSREAAHQELTHIAKHPLELYIQLNLEQDMFSDGVYNVMTMEWLKGPLIRDFDFDPYVYYNHLAGDIRKMAQEMDIEFGELKRDTIDYDVIKTAISGLPIEKQIKLRSRLTLKISEVEEDIKKLMLLKKDIVDKRHNVTRSKESDSEYEIINTEFKFLDRYEYLKIIKDLEKIVEDDVVEPEEIEKVKALLLKKKS
jgi:hypothetical protein